MSFTLLLGGVLKKKRGELRVKSDERESVRREKRSEDGWSKCVIISGGIQENP